MDTFHPDIRRALESEIPLSRFELFRRAIYDAMRSTHGKEQQEIHDEIERDLEAKTSSGEITMQEKLILKGELEGPVKGPDYGRMGS